MRENKTNNELKATILYYKDQLKYKKIMDNCIKIINNSRAKLKIYTIKHHTENIQYIGSTRSTLSVRMSQHKHAFQKWLDSDKDSKKHTAIIFQYFEEYGIENFEIKLLEEFVCVDHEEENTEKRKKEQECIEKTDCINKVAAYITEQERNQYRKEYREKVSEQSKEYKAKWYQEKKKDPKYVQQQKEYRIEHKDKAIERTKKWRENNKNNPKYIQRLKDYAEKNKEHIKIQQKKKYEKNKEKLMEKIDCDACKCQITRGFFKTHIKTKKHQHYLQHPDIPYVRSRN